ncbi:Neuronal acetylcholine receptor subunit [Mactra antiquata]
MAAWSLKLLFLYAILCQEPVFSTWQDSRNLYYAIYDHYYNNGTSLTDILPVLNQTEPMIILMSLALNSLNSFDAVTGQIEISGSMQLSWYDEVINGTVDLSTYNVDSVLIDHDKAWSPSIVLVNAVDTVQDIGDTTYKLRYNTADGSVEWSPRVLLRCSCSPDVTYYPFDRQVCDFTYTAWGYKTEEIRLQVKYAEWDISDYEENSVWKIVSTSTSVFFSGDKDYTNFQITIEREPLYFILNVALPILLLGLLNGFVFLLPAESGERIGFSITCFLSFVVLMQTTMDFLPQIASPMSLLCVYVFLMMCCSVFVNIVTILMMRVYHKPEKEKVPNIIQKIIRVLRCKVCKKADRENPPEITWPDVARILDFFFFLVFLGGQAALTVFFIVPLGTQY